MEQLFTCPFDPSHRVAVLRLQNHIAKCQRNNPDVKIKVCPFNATHILRLPDFKNHVYTCPDNIMVFRSKAEENDDDNDDQEMFLTKTSNTSIAPPTRENWEDEFVADSVLETIQNKPPVKFMDPSRLSGLKPSEKKVVYGSLAASGSDADSWEEVKKIEATVQPQPFKKLRMPVVYPETPVLQALHRGRGRGILADIPRPVERPGRIAANIFSQGDANLKWTGGQSRPSGIGRGRAICRPSEKINATPNAYISSTAETTKTIKEVYNYKSTGDERSSHNSDPQMTAGFLNDKTKELFKRLNQITILEEKQENNVQLSEAEILMISERVKVEEQLQNLRLRD